MSEPSENDAQQVHDCDPDDGSAARGRPPREYRFKPGTSGNPRGRPRGSRNFATLIQRELDRTITATVSGRQTKVAKREAIIMRLVEKALKGDHKSIEAILKYGDEGSSEIKLPPMDTDPARESEILDAYLRRLDDGGAGHG
ncbi:DUF5681 domain-containing protein [Sphingomonas aerophila]|uniref:DUF5681 domain-containing protein n=1 Tax=Sphingomonas aerophila TaxID=1344948 RepID=A0A7W9BGB8_9SPHN|nr:DUF5681 domain-containing protein [Sphingomonas aerophila]MBB5716612.1 hypothetical protein [Sphingomonas aerophila]